MDADEDRTLDEAELKENRELLVGDFEGTADWRRNKASEYPDDERNLHAAKLLDRLAGTVGDVPPDLLNAYFELFDVEVHSEMLRSIGFQWDPETATEFVTEFIRARTSED